MKIKQYQVDAFATRVFEGNPAAICPLDEWLQDGVMQAIAEENNLSETAFFVASGGSFQLRWFTPTTEVDLCGHATLAAAHVIFKKLNPSASSVIFETRSGKLFVERQGDLLRMNFPARRPVQCEIPDLLAAALGSRPAEVLCADDYLAVFNSEEVIRVAQPDQALLAQLDLRGVVITAPGSDVDFVSRCFGPKLGITEDPVTGSAHCELAPYWANKLGKTRLTAKQLSKRGGKLVCEFEGDRVALSGTAVIFMEAEIFLNV